MKKNICVVGAGYWGKNHIKTLDQLQSLEGIVEIDDNTIKVLSKNYPNIKFHKSISDSLKENYDGFVVATPAKTHFSISKRIINARKPVLIEKPLTLSIEEAEELVELAEDKKVNAMVGHVLLFHPAIMRIKEIIENGEIGELQYIYSNRLNLGTVRTEENVFWSFAPHDIAIFQYLTNSLPEKISANASTFLQKGIPDSTLMHLDYKNSVKGHIFVSWLHPFKEHRLVVIGSEAMISFEDSINENQLKFYSKRINLDSGVPQKIDGPVKTVSFDKKLPLELELEYFLNHLVGKKPTISNVKNGLQVVKILVEASKQILK